MISSAVLTQSSAPKMNFSFASKNDLQLSDAAFKEWRDFIYTICGIYFQDNKKYLLESRLQKRITYLGIDSFEKYFSYIKFNPRKEEELKYLYEVITINETYFFRNQPQLDALVSDVLPEIMASPTKLNKNKLRIWSAASSSGEEAYSIAMTLTELVKPKYPRLEIEIVGTDISKQVVETANKAVYREYSIRNTPAFYLKKYFTQDKNGYEVIPSIRNLVNFKVSNLYDEIEMRAMMNFDVIYCANVLIYFDTNSKIKVVNSLYNGLNRGGYLFIGYSETLHGISKAFKLVSYPKTIGYKKE
ncbi:MAG: protein-glutamate O-methyltransferase CheR [bacterium]